jgi:hypothetical protein
MKKERANTKVILIDIQFHESLNYFEYQYGEFVSYKQMEQRSYIDFKELMFDNICREIKFRKFGRVGKILTIKAEMLKGEVDRLRIMLEGDGLNIGTGWIISNVTLIRDDRLSDKNSKYQKVKNEDEDEDDESQIEEEVDDLDEL